MHPGPILAFHGFKAKACINCRKRKIKCDGSRPTCAQCARSLGFQDREYAEDGATTTQIPEERIAMVQARIEVHRKLKELRTSIGIFNPHTGEDRAQELLLFCPCRIPTDPRRIVDPAGETTTLLDIATLEGFQVNNRRLRSLVSGVDISVIEAALKAAGVLANQATLLEKLFCQLCTYSLAPITYVFIFDGPRRHSVKRGPRVVHRPARLIEHLRIMITGFGFYFYDAPAEAEAELAQLNASGAIDGIITDDSDALVKASELN
ncbi:hypothetical protein C8J57DRAFT_1531418 [Mycena rebaudengoi]|nr:hypothetical protein C8J57DRAFT_1531418 [Mycena rebaudengoi]